MPTAENEQGGISLWQAEAIPKSIAWVVAGILLLASIVLHARMWITADTSWQLTLGSDFLDGRAIYGDVIEVNPPASMLLYLPAVAIARASGLRPELITSILVFMAGIVSTTVSLDLLRRSGLLPRRLLPWCLSVAIAILFILPGFDFSQREHVAVIAMLPVMAVIALRLRGGLVPLLFALLAGLGLGVMVSIKPHFALGYAPMVAWVMWRKKSLAYGWKPEHLCAAAVVLAYATVTFFYFPRFVTDVLPVLRDVYLPVRASLGTLLLSPPVLMTSLMAMLSFGVARTRTPDTLAFLPFLGSIGFLIEALLQGKGWLYHFYPALALGMISLAITLASVDNGARERRIGCAGLVLLFGLSTAQFMQTYDDTELFAKLKTIAPLHPRIITASADIEDGHPITRWLDGTWVGSSSSLWASAGASHVLATRAVALTPADRARITNEADQEAARFVEDVDRGRPDIVLVGGAGGLAWIASHPGVAGALSPYHQAGRAKDIFILTRIR